MAISILILHVVSMELVNQNYRHCSSDLVIMDLIRHFRLCNRVVADPSGRAV